MMIIKNFAVRIGDLAAIGDILTNLGVEWKVISRGLEIQEIEIKMPWELKRIVEERIEDYFGDY